MLGQATATPPFMAGPSGVPSQDPQNAATLQKLAQLLQTLGQKQQAQGGGQPTNPVVSEARVPQIKFDPRGGATMQPPQAGPTSGDYMPPPFGAEMMSKLDPHGAATFSAIQGVSQVLQDFENRKQQREQAEASNIAQNLMQAIESGDVKTQQDILNDKHATKVLNKVYKGWLTKAQESQQPQEPPDPAVSGFEAGIRQHVQKKQQAQGQPKPQGVTGGYRMPAQSPQQQLQAAMLNAQLQKAKQDPASLLESQLTSQEIRQMQLIAGQLKVSPAEIEKIQMAENIAEMRGAVDLQKQAQKDQADYTKQLLANQGRENAATIAARAHVEAEQVIANARLQAVKYSVKYKTGVIPLAARMKLQALQGAQKMLDDLVSGKTSTGVMPTQGASPYVQLTQMLKSAGLTQSASELPVMGTHLGGDKKLKQIKQNVDTYLQEYQKTLLNMATGSVDISESKSGPTKGAEGGDELDKALDQLFPPDGDNKDE